MNFDRDVAFPNKIRIIDLLNKIANGEEVPKKIKVFRRTFKWILDDYISSEEDCEGISIHKFIFSPLLNDEVEIIEEDKEIEKLNNIPINYADDRTPEEVYEYLRCTINNLANVINTSNENLLELIDKVNSLEKNQ